MSWLHPHKPPPPKKIPTLLLKNSWLAHLHDTAAANEAGGVTNDFPGAKRAAKLLLWKERKIISVFVALNCKPVLVCVGFNFRWFYYSINLTHFLKGWKMDPFGPAFQEWNEHLGHILVIELGLDPHEEYPQIWESIYYRPTGNLIAGLDKTAFLQIVIWLKSGTSPKTRHYTFLMSCALKTVQIFQALTNINLVFPDLGITVLRKKGAFFNPGHTVFPLCDLKMHA